MLASPAHVIAVSEQIGWDVVPVAASARLFRDAMGRMVQRLAKHAEPRLPRRRRLCARPACGRRIDRPRQRWLKRSVLVTFLAAVVVLAVLAKRLRVPYPIAFVIGGIALAFTRHLPRPHIEPDLIMLLVVPPLLYGAAWSTDWLELKRNARPITLHRRRAW